MFDLLTSAPPVYPTDFKGEQPTSIPPVYSKAVKGDQQGYRIDLTAIQFFNAEQWESWITDRLQGRDIVLPLDPRQGEEPEFLFIDLIPRLGKARETAECAIEDVLSRALAEHWADAPLAALFYLIEKLSIVSCVDALRRYLDAPFKMSPAPYRRALSTMAEFAGEYPIPFEDWRTWTKHDRENLLPGCFADLIDSQPEIAIRLLGTAKWDDWQNSPVVEALLDELEIYFLSTVPEPLVEAELVRFARDFPDFSEAVSTILPEVGNLNGWSIKLFLSSRSVGTLVNRHEKIHDVDVEPSSSLFRIVGA